VTRRRAGGVCVALGVVALVLGVTVSPAHASPPEKVGWWFQPLSGPLALPVPAPVVPEGGMFVQQGATTEPLAIGAVRYAAADGSSNALTLTAAPGSVALTTTMQACKTTSPWEATPAGPGAWDQRPSYGSPCTPGSVAADGSAVVFALNASFVSSGVLDVAIVPLVAATPFAVAFAPPDSDSLQSSSGKASTSPTLPTAAPVTGGGAPSGRSASPSAVVPSGSPSATPAAPSAPAPATQPRSAVAENVLNVVGLGDADRGARMASLGGASLIIVGWWLLSTRTVPLPRLLGGVGAGVRASGDDEEAAKGLARIGGVGRFARTRAGNPLKLR
jgi:hypothetical protein